MKIFMIPLALSLVMAAGSAQAFSHSVKNISRVTIKFWVNYSVCSNDSFTLKPGELVTWRAGLCCLRTGNAQIGKTIQTAGASLNKPTLCGNSNWVVDGYDEAYVTVKRI
jgi:hypothetical protein